MNMISYFSYELKIYSLHQLLVGSVVIDDELGRKSYGSIPGNCDRKEVGTT
jgi:hypothetical protein